VTFRPGQSALFCWSADVLESLRTRIAMFSQLRKHEF
jgi:hypothetical protein